MSQYSHCPCSRCKYVKDKNLHLDNYKESNYVFITLFCTHASFVTWNVDQTIHNMLARPTEKGLPQQRNGLMEVQGNFKLVLHYYYRIDINAHQVRSY